MLHDVLVRNPLRFASSAWFPQSRDHRILGITPSVLSALFCGLLSHLLNLFNLFFKKLPSLRLSRVRVTRRNGE
jgi:hypothetical protein